MHVTEPKRTNDVTEIKLESNREMSKLLRAVYDGEYGEWVRVNDFGYLHYSSATGEFYYAVKEKDINYSLFQHTAKLIAHRAGCGGNDIEWETAGADGLHIPGLRSDFLRLAKFKPKGKK